MLLTWILLVIFIKRYYQYGHKEESSLHCSVSMFVTGIWKMCTPCGRGGGEDDGEFPLTRFYPHFNMPQGSLPLPILSGEMLAFQKGEVDRR